ncbi:MAG: hypothetical protein WCK58_05495 [Chloroflexota bacterium]
MRGCLFTLVLAAALAFIVVNVGLPAVAAGALTATITAAGLQAPDTVVTVASDPTTELLGLHADSVHVTATGATFRDLKIGSLDLTLSDVSGVDRTVGTVDGTLTDVTVTSLATGPVLLRTIAIAGGSDAITVSTAIANADAEALVSAAVLRATGSRPTSVTLASPNLVTVVVGGAKVSGHLLVTGSGDLSVQIDDGPGAGTSTVLLQGGTDLPIRLTKVSIGTAGNLRISGTLAIGLLG